MADRRAGRVGRRSRVRWVVLALLIVVITLVTVITVVAVTVSNSNQRSEDTVEAPPSTQAGLTTPTTVPLDSKNTHQGRVTTLAATTEAQPATRNVTLRAISVFTAERLEVKLNFTFEYHISPEDLDQVTGLYGSGYEPVLIANIVDEVKRRTGSFTVREFLYDRDRIERGLFDAVRRRLGGSCCKPSCQDLPEGCEAGCKLPQDCTDQDRGLYTDVRSFHLDFVDIPDFVLSRLLTTVSPRP